VADELAAKLTDEAISKAQGKLAAKAQAQAEKAEKAVARAERLRGSGAGAAREIRVAQRARAKQAVFEALAQADAVDIWTRAEPADRRPRFTRDQIATAALRVADEEGFEALSMRRLAAELDAGTMTLYHYVRTKDELLALVSDLVMGEVTLKEGEQLPDDWRAAITIIARRSRDALLRHPWVLEVADDPPIGPNAVRHFDQTMEALGSLDVGLDEKIDIAMLVDEYVFGYCMQRRINDQPQSTDVDHRVVGYVESLIDTGRYPALSELVARFGFRPTWDRIQASFGDEERFTRNLKRILDGVEANLPKGPG
jgi:AcrR family transcriptional regulator